MNLSDTKEDSSGIYDAFKDEVCEECNERIKEKLSKLSKVKMALLIARPKLIHRKLGICQNCINNIHRKLLKNQRK